MYNESCKEMKVLSEDIKNIKGIGPVLLGTRRLTSSIKNHFKTIKILLGIIEAMLSIVTRSIINNHCHTPL